MNISKHRDLIVGLIAVLWFVCIITGTSGHYVFGMCMGVVLMFLHMILGVAKNGVVSKKFLRYPLLVWAALWLVSFLTSGYYGSLFGNAMPAFTVFGFHPSFAPTIFLYWIGGMLTLNLGLYLCQDEWLSEKDWEDFRNKVNSLKGVK